MKCKFKKVIFDFDGTIVDSSSGILKGIELVLEQNNIRFSKNQVMKLVGQNLFEGFVEMFGVGEDMSEVLVKQFRMHYEKEGVNDFLIYPKIDEIISELCDDGCKLYIATLKPQFYTEKMLASCGLLKYFYKIYGTALNKNFTTKEELISLSLTGETNAVMIGDRKYDIEAGKKIGITTIGVTYGFGSKEELKAAKADYICDTASSLKKILFT